MFIRLLTTFLLLLFSAQFLVFSQEILAGNKLSSSVEEKLDEYNETFGELKKMIEEVMQQDSISTFHHTVKDSFVTILGDERTHPFDYHHKQVHHLYLK